MTATRAVTVPVEGGTIQGDLSLPTGTSAIVVFAHGSGSSRHSPRNRQVAERLRSAGLGTLLLDLLTAPEEATYLATADLRFDIDLLADRLVAAVGWLDGQEDLRHLALGYFGASTGAAAALVAAARQGERIGAVVSRGGRPDLAGDSLAAVRAPTLLIVGGRDETVLRLNRQADRRLGGERRLEVVPGTTHLFEEPGAIERVAGLAADWFTGHLVDTSAEARTPRP